MKILQTMVLVSTGVAGLGVMGCLSVERPRRTETVYVERAPEATYVIVTEAPPAPRIVERRPPPPAREYVWVDGYYAWSGREYVWQAGNWAMPPRGFTLWIGPRYDREDRGYRYTPGHWQPGDHDNGHENKKQDRR